MENREIPGRSQMELFIPVEIFWKKVIPFEVLPFFHFYGNDRHFVYHLFGLPSARLPVERKRKIFYRYFENGTTQSRSCFLCQKEYQYHLTKNFQRNFCTSGKHSW